jgi:hypothetical protein
MEYEVGIKGMTRDELERFAISAAQAMESLERDNAQLRFDLSTTSSVDPDVINQWREWLQTVEAEREKWSDLATTKSIENNQLIAENRHMRSVCQAILETLDSIGKIAHDQADPKRQSITLVRTLEQIRDAAFKDKGSVLQFLLQEPPYETTEDEPEKEPEEEPPALEGHEPAEVTADAPA